MLDVYTLYMYTGILHVAVNLRGFIYITGYAALVSDGEVVLYT